MSADSFHHGVEQQMRNRPGGVVYDFEDLVCCGKLQLQEGGCCPTAECQRAGLEGWPFHYQGEEGTSTKAWRDGGDPGAAWLQEFVLQAIP